MSADLETGDGATAYQPFYLSGQLSTAADVARELARLAQVVLAGTVDPQRAAVAREALVRARDMLAASAKDRRQNPDRSLLIQSGARLPTAEEIAFIARNGRVPPGTAVAHVLLIDVPEAPPPAPSRSDVVREGDDGNDHRVSRLVPLR